MIVALTLAAGAALYGWGLWRVRQLRRPFPAFAPAAFGAGLLVIAAALSPPMDALADASLSWHMVQHLVLISVAASSAFASSFAPASRILSSPSNTEALRAASLAHRAR